jgi:CO/xanthine dehydrogenase Mo-binding subunit
VLNSRKSDEWGQAVPRTEDPRLLTGRGRYPEDFVLPRLAHAYVLRSPYAHAHIRSVDIRAAQQTPGVLAVLTGEDWAAEQFGAPRPNQDRSIPHPNERCRLIPLPQYPGSIGEQNMQVYRNRLLQQQWQRERYAISPSSERSREIQQQLNQTGPR